MAPRDWPPKKDLGKARRQARRGERREARQEAFGTAFSGLTNALRESGLGNDEADRFSRLILSRPSVTIGRGGRIRHKGQRYDAADFATSALADFVTGRTAERRNKAAIEGDPGYLQELASLGLTRDEALAALDEQRRRQILDFGDPSFTNDPRLAGEAGANPFSTSRMMRQAYDQQLSGVRQASNRLGTLFGGGYASGVAGADRAYAGQSTEAIRSLQDLLAGLSKQSAGARQSYELGRGASLQSAAQRLLESGQIHAALPPSLKNLGYNYWNDRRNRKSELYAGWKGRGRPNYVSWKGRM